MDIHTIHNIFIFLHAAAGAISFFAGGYIIFSSKHLLNRRLFDLYWWSLVGLVVFLAGAMIVYWVEYSGTERLIFPGLFVLGIYMLYRARNARRLVKDQEYAPNQDSIEHIGFTLISLFEGFIIVGALNSSLPGWLVAILAIIGVLLGRSVIGFAKRRVG